MKKEKTAIVTEGAGNIGVAVRATATIHRDAVNNAVADGTRLKPVQNYVHVIRVAMVLGLMLNFRVCITGFAQKTFPPIPVEVLMGNETVYYQMIMSKPFAPQSRFNFLGLAAYGAPYENKPENNLLATIAQVSYAVGKGFGIMTGTDINSVSGFSYIIGPQHNFASKQFLAVTIASFLLNEGNDFKIFGLYEYKPSLGKKWSVYSRFQFIYNTGLREGIHHKSYAHLRAGLKRKALVFGFGANLDRAGPNKKFTENYGGFIRWEFK